VPEWAKKAVWYQIFPERFWNGDPGNDPKVEDIKGSWPPGPIKEWRISPWTSDWYALQPWEAKDDRGFYYHVQRRRYGGDLQGVLDKLDYLTELGINAIYFNPIFESPSLHKYDATYYHHVDNNFGPDPEGDRAIWAQEDPADPSTWKWTAADRLFLKLLEECHRRGIKVIIDGVFNHVGKTFWAFRDVVEKQQKSPYKDWFLIKSWDDPRTPENEFDYGGWFGVRELPEIREDDRGLVEGPRQHIFQAVRRWMDPNGDGDPSDGVDGWRLDVAHMVHPDFWRDFRRWVRSINPEAYLVGEVWWEDWRNSRMFNARPWLEGDMFDAVMNYRWAAIAIRFFVNRKEKSTASEFDAELRRLREDYPPEVNYVLQNLLDSHDTDRLASMIVNPDRPYEHGNSPRFNPDYDVRKPTPEEFQIQKLIALFQMTYLGAPMIYYGDEAGMWGADDPDDRKPMLWPDLTYEDEVSHPLGAKRPRDKNEFNRDLFEHYKKLIHIRRQHPALMLGDFRTLLTDDSRDLYVFERTHSTERIVVALNNSSQAQELTLPLSDVEGTLWVDLLTGEKFSVKNGKLSVPLDRKWGRILRQE